MAGSYPYSITEPHVHDFSGRNESNQTVCAFCGAKGAGNSGSGRRTITGSNYIDYKTTARLPGRRAKW